jgi:predicted ATPase
LTDRTVSLRGMAIEVPRIERLHVRNYRALRDVRLDKLTPLTVLLGPNGSGKSTLFDVFGFLAESLRGGLRPAWDKRGRLRELRSREAQGPISFELSYRERPKTPLITYGLEIDEDGKGRPIVRHETLRWKRRNYGHPFNFLDFSEGAGQVVSGELPEEADQRRDATLASSDLLAVSTLGQLAENPRVVALRTFIEGWYLSYLSSNDARGVPDAGPMERLSQTGDNLSNVVQYLSENHPERLKQILEVLSERVPRLERVTAEPLADGRLLLLIKDAPFREPFLARFASDGTLKMLAYLVLLYDPEPQPLLGIEEPENYLHPRLLQGLAEECRKVSANSQVFVSTHSPFFVNGLLPRELWALERDREGYTQATRVADMPKINEFMEQGAQLGALWMEGHLSAGDPLRNSHIEQVVRD